MRTRVGARHWLVLGILSQMPRQSIHLKALGHILHSIVPGTNTKPTVELLRSRGHVTFNPETQVITLTEDGAGCHRQRGRLETPWFVRVPDQFVRLAG